MKLDVQQNQLQNTIKLHISLNKDQPKKNC